MYFELKTGLILSHTALTHYHTMPHFDTLKIYSYGKNIVRKREISCNKQFLLFSGHFPPYMAFIFHLNLFPKDNLDSSKPNEFADNNFKVDENGRKFSKHVGNTVGKGEIACYTQCLLYPQCFQKACTADM